MSNSQSQPPLCQFDSVSKWYGPVIAVNDVSFRLEPGITGLVGHNGAGKSTLIKLLTGQLRPSLGKANVCGYSAWSATAKNYVGYCPDVDAFYEEMLGRRFVQTMARLRGFSRVDAEERTNQVLAQVGMTDRADRPLASYSKGMRQRIKLAQGLTHDPQLVVLDEPLNGVDPVGRVDMVRLFRELANQGKAVLISSHILDEMDRLADRILFICRGRILASGSLEQIRAMLEDHPMQLRVTSDRSRELAAQVLSLPSVRGVQLQEADDLFLEVQRSQEFFHDFRELVVNDGYEVERMQVMDASTEAVFDYLMQKASRL